MPIVYHMVHYRKCMSGSSEFKSQNFEQVCRAALSKKNKAGTSLWQRAEDRLYKFSQPDERQILLNKVADLTSAVAGEMCLTQTNGLQALLEMQAAKVQLSNITLAEIFALNEKTAPVGSRFVRGMAYWVAINNHLFFVKTQNMNSELMHIYFDWLFKSCTSMIRNESQFVLQAEFDKSQLSGDIGDIKSLKVSGKSAPQLSIIVPGDLTEENIVKTSRLVKAGEYTFEKARAVAEAIFGKTKSDSLVQSLGPDEYLSVDAAVRVRGRRTEASKNKMRQLANDLSDLTEGKIQIEGKDGRVSDDDAIIRTRMPFNLSQDGSSLLEFDNVADQIQEVYLRFVKDGKILA